jgi:predicted GIY-YIG superfamily endonuclease
MTTFLYRLWNSNDELLYVGISKSAVRRLEQHLSDKPWADQIVKQTAQAYESRDAAIEAEREAIKKEKPRHNILHNKTPEADLLERSQLLWRHMTDNQRAEAIKLARNLSVACGQLPGNTKRDELLAGMVALWSNSQDVNSDELCWLTPKAPS